LNIHKLIPQAMVAIVALACTATVAAKTDGRLITVMNPVVESKLAERLPLSPRLDTLAGKTLYMVDINWGGPQAGYSVFQQMEAWLASNIPSVTVVIVRKNGPYMTEDPALWQEIADKGDAAIVGISG